MGHTHLPTLPSTRRWRQVVDLIEDGAAAGAVAAASAYAAERELAAAQNSAVLQEAVRLLVLLPQAAQEGEFAGGLRRLGLAVPDQPLLFDLVGALGASLDGVAQRLGGRDDFGALVRRSLLGTISAAVGEKLPGLFGSDSEDLRLAVASIGRPNEFSRATRAFFGRLVATTLSCWLDRTLTAQVGPNRRFGRMQDREDFERALDQYCAEATRIIQEFSCGWYAKTLYRDNAMTNERITAFSAVALKKIISELLAKRDG